MPKPDKNPYLAALEWHLSIGADEALLDAPNDRTVAPVRQALPDVAGFRDDMQNSAPHVMKTIHFVSTSSAAPAVAEPAGTAAARAEAVRLAQSCRTLEELRAAVEGFDGLAIRKTATQAVFADGNPRAHVMLVGEAPGADEDRQGKPFVGVSGQLLDRIVACIGLSRKGDDPASSLYISNILNWRPPGNRTPSPAEIDISLPFIERHIALVKPKVLILCGGVAAKGLLGSGEAISKLRGRFHTYTPITPSISEEAGAIQSIATYHPSYLLRTPSQKKLVWADMLMLKEFLNRE